MLSVVQAIIAFFVLILKRFESNDNKSKVYEIDLESGKRFEEATSVSNENDKVKNDESDEAEPKKLIEPSDVVAIKSIDTIMEMENYNLGALFHEEPIIKVEKSPVVAPPQELSFDIWPPRRFVTERIGIMKAQWEARMSGKDYSDVNHDILHPRPPRSNVAKIIDHLQTKYGASGVCRADPVTMLMHIV